MLKDSHQLQQALAIIKNDLRSATIPGGVLSTNMSTSFELTGSGGSQFEFHTASGLLNTATPWIDIQRVTYFPPTARRGHPHQRHGPDPRNDPQPARRRAGGFQ